MCLEWNKIVLIMCVCLFVDAYAKPLPLLDNENYIPNTPHHRKIINLMQACDGNLLDLSYSGLKDEDVPKIITFLKTHPEITRLNLSGNHLLTGNKLVPLAEISSLMEIDLSRRMKSCDDKGCIGGLDAKDIVPFAKNKSLKVLNLGMNSIGDEGAHALAQNTTIESLNVHANEINDESGAILAQNKNLKDLDLSANDAVGVKTAKSIGANQSLEKVALRQTRVGDDGAIEIAKSKSIKILDLGLADVTDTGAIALAQNPHLQDLEICMNSVSITGAAALAKNRTLKTLSLCPDFFLVDDPQPRIGDKGVALFADSINLKTLVLIYQSITDEGLQKLIQNRSLQHLWLGVNPLHDKSAYAIAAHAPQLQTLGLPYTRLTDDGMAALSNLPNLKYLSLSVGHIGDAGAKALSKSKSIEILELDVNLIYDGGGITLAQNEVLKYLNVSFNCMTEIGNRAIENSHTLRQVNLGGENFFFPCEKSAVNIKKSPNPIEKMRLLGKFICYRTQKSMHCMDSIDRS